jgi:hypothetical protein
MALGGQHNQDGPRERAFVAILSSLCSWFMYPPQCAASHWDETAPVSDYLNGGQVSRSELVNIGRALGEGLLALSPPL